MKISILGLVLLLSTNLAFAAKVGMPAPDFTGTDSAGHKITLAQYKGKYVVLEWHNKDCPYVKAQYDSGNMQKLQKEWTANGVIWLSVVSSAKGKQGYVTAKGAKADLKKTHAKPTAMLLDPTGEIGHAYDAKTTPHMFVIDPQGTLIYNGAIDDKQSNDKTVVPKSNNYVSLALNQALAGKPLTQPTTQPYGCGVKY